MFQAVIKLELDRQENDRQIALLYNSMSNMLVVLAYTDEIFARQDDLHTLMDKKLGEIVALINEFGNFCDVYYKHRSIGESDSLPHHHLPCMLILCDLQKSDSCVPQSTKKCLQALLKALPI